MRACVLCSQKQFFLRPRCGYSIKEVTVGCTRNGSIKGAAGTYRYWWWTLITINILYRCRGMIGSRDLIKMAAKTDLLSWETILQFPCVAHARPRDGHWNILRVEMFIWASHSNAFASAWSGIMFPHVHIRILTCTDHIFSIFCDRGGYLPVCVAKPCQRININLQGY